MAEDAKPAMPYGDLPGNSKKDRAKVRPEGKLDKIIGDAGVVERKKPLGKRIMESLSGDDSRTVGNYILFDVMIPAFKQLVSDVVSTGVERTLFGENARTGTRRGYTPYNRVGPGTPTNYGTVSTQRSPISRTPQPDTRDTTNKWDSIVLDSRGPAEQVIDALVELINTYEVATVSDLYELVGITGNYTDEKWGWDSMVGARVERVREGYWIRLPKIAPLE